MSQTEINIALIALSGLVLVLALLSGWLKERLWLSDPVLALLVGVLVGPSILSWINLAHWGNQEMILEQGARIAIAIQVMGITLRLPKAYPFKQWRNLTVLLWIVMLLMWVTLHPGYTLLGCYAGWSCDYSHRSGYCYLGCDG